MNEYTFAVTVTTKFPEVKQEIANFIEDALGAYYEKVVVQKAVEVISDEPETDMSGKPVQEWMEEHLRE